MGSQRDGHDLTTKHNNNKFFHMLGTVCKLYVLLNWSFNISGHNDAVAFCLFVWYLVKQVIPNVHIFFVFHNIIRKYILHKELSIISQEKNSLGFLKLYYPWFIKKRPVREKSKALLESWAMGEVRKAAKFPSPSPAPPNDPESSFTKVYKIQWKSSREEAPRESRIDIGCLCKKGRLAPGPVLKCN